MTQELDGWPVQILRKPIKRMYLRMDPGTRNLNISVPRGTPLSVIEEFVRKNRSWIEQRMVKENEFRLWGRPCPPCGEEERIRLYERQMNEKLPERTRFWEQATRLRPESYILKNMKSRWGSCSREKGRICLNIQLAAYPVRCLDYVIVHELCHLKVANHSAAFWQEVQRYIPDWKKIREQLK